MSTELYIGQLKLNVISDAFLVEISFEENPPHQNRLRELPSWTLTSKNAIWMLREEASLKRRAEDGEKIKKALTTFLTYSQRPPTLVDAAG